MLPVCTKQIVYVILDLSLYTSYIHNCFCLFLFQCKEVATEYKSQLKQHIALLQRIGQLVPNCLRQGLTNHYWYVAILHRPWFDQINLPINWDCHWLDIFVCQPCSIICLNKHYPIVLVYHWIYWYDVA